MQLPYITLLGKAVRKIAMLRGGGSALPGLFIERIDPDFIKRTLSQLPQGVVVISGTNGKTTTTKMTVELLESQGLRVFTNRTGSNFTRGVAAALLAEVDRKGTLKADIAVLELDEAHAVHFVKIVPPQYSLLLNVMRDQLDRFGEIDSTAKLLAKIALSTTDTVVFNREDPRIVKIASLLSKDQKAIYFGLSPELLSLFPNDDDIHSEPATIVHSKQPADVILSKLDDDKAQFTINNRTINTTLALKGVYNVYNAAAALALARTILGDKVDDTKLIEALARVTPAFGRGETLTVDGHPLEIVLVKNPSGFRLSLSSFNPDGYKTMIAINDNYADGRDMSWLWDVDFDTLRPGGVSTISGIRAYDMALRLQYDEVETAHVDRDLAAGLRHFINDSAGVPKRIFCTYTAMLAIRRELAKITDVETIS
jgi:lipid II isoglutaminyl synthase (glutamine-hydrolysing)